VTSDPVRLAVSAGENLAISIYGSGPTGTTTTGGSLQHANYVSAPGDVAGTTSAAAFPSSAKAWYCLSGVDVLPSLPSAAAVVALGDSITAGFDSTPDANHDWVDVLANGLRRGREQFSELNAGISGNSLQADSPCFGRSGLRRLTRDVLSQSDVRYVILALGTNDITQPTEPPSAPLLSACREVASQRPR
jgi:lysophospholipase L1-like esterase